MEVLVGFGVTSSAEASQAYVRGAADAGDHGQGATGPTTSRRMTTFNRGNCYGDAEEEDDEVVESDRSSSSIGVPDDTDEDEEDEVLSKDARNGLGSLGSLDMLEHSLPVKRGLSNHFSGKSKSFTNLAEAIATASTKDIEKTEHPFNKKRRIQRWSKNRMLPTTLSMPLLRVPEEEEEDDSPRDEYEGYDGNRSDGDKRLPTPRSVFKSYSCFALTDLREEEEEEED